MRRFALPLGILLLTTGAMGQSYELTIHLRTGETITIPHDGIRRLEFAGVTTGQPDLQSAAFLLLPNFPNPFNPSTTIAYEIPATSHVTVRIYDLHGALLSELINKTQDAGRHEVRWDGTGAHRTRLASGVYLCAVACNGATLSQRLMLVK